MRFTFIRKLSNQHSVEVWVAAPELVTGLPKVQKYTISTKMTTNSTNAYKNVRKSTKNTKKLWKECFNLIFKSLNAFPIKLSLKY